MHLPNSIRTALPNLKYTLWLPVYLIIFILLEQRPLENYWTTQIPLDQYIPFCEWFAIPYCLWYPLLIGIGIHLLFQDSPAFRRYMRFLAATFLSSALIWLLIPNGQDLRPQAFLHQNVLTDWMETLYRIDTHTNVFPSVHVVGSIGASVAAWDSRAFDRKPWIPILVSALSGLICLSVVFVKQHGILDLFGGLLLAAPTAFLIYRTP